MALKDKIARLEATTRTGPREIEVIGGVSDVGGQEATINSPGKVIRAELGEGVTAFRARCRTMAGPGGWVVYSGLG